MFLKLLIYISNKVGPLPIKIIQNRWLITIGTSYAIPSSPVKEDRKDRTVIYSYDLNKAEEMNNEPKVVLTSTYRFAREDLVVFHPDGQGLTALGDQTVIFRFGCDSIDSLIKDFLGGNVQDTNVKVMKPKKKKWKENSERKLSLRSAKKNCL